MTNDIRLAFAHPEERAEASAGAAPRDRISLRDHVAEVEIGAFQQERGTRQRVRFNVVVEVRPHPAPLQDDVDRILSYDRITESIGDELSAERLNLLETLAERIAERILAEPQAMRVFVRIEKLDRGPGALGVEIVRSRAEAPLRRTGEGGEAVHPLVAFLDNAAIAAPDLPARLDALEARGCRSSSPWACPTRRGPRRATARPSAGSTFWPSSRMPGRWPPAIRDAWWWPPGPRSTGRCGAARPSSGRPPSWCSMRWTGRIRAIRWRWPCGWRRCWRPSGWSFTAM